MRAVVIPGEGQQLQTSAQPLPEVPAGHLGVRVRSAALNPSDWKLAFGVFPPHPDQPYPLTLGRDFVGVVSSVGDGVADYHVDDVVCGMVPDRPLVHGSLAEVIVVPTGPTVARLRGEPAARFATLGVAGTTAVAAVQAVACDASAVVLVVGAGGGVGTFVVQLLAAEDVTVVAVLSPDNAERVHALGADLCLDRAADWEAEVRERWPDGVDALIDLTAAGTDFERRLALVVRGGRATSPLHPDAESSAARERDLTVMPADGGGDGALARLVAMTEDGRLQPVVDHVVLLEDAARALAQMRAGELPGKVVVDVTP